MTKRNSSGSKVKKVGQVLKKEGPTGLALRVLKKTETSLQKHSKVKKEFTFLVGSSEVEKARWATHPYTPLAVKKDPPYKIHWVMSPPGKGSGGHQNIFRFISYLEGKGHLCQIYLYTNSKVKPTLDEIHKVLETSYPKTSAKIEWLDGDTKEADIIFATGWETAYPVFNDKNRSKKFYFIQDFEPYFYPLGSEYILAENTYRFNFTGVTAGRWLTNKLSTDYDMVCDNYDFGAEKSLYQYKNKNARKEVLFYARPVTPRRGFELGIMALEIFHEQYPDYTINLAGWDVSDHNIPFPYKNLKTMSLEELSDVYNRCATALVISLTNMSLLPLELLACGTIPVVTDGENNRQVSNNEYIEYALPSPDALAEAMGKVITKENLTDYARAAADSVVGADWDAAGQKVETILKEHLNV